MRTTLWCGAVMAFFLSLSLLLRGHLAAGVVFFFACIICCGSAEVGNDRQRRLERFHQRFSSLDEVRQAVDASTLRRIRDENGVAVAVRTLKRQFPEVPLAEAAKLVKEL
ncbi:hypothetical protein AB0C51_13125 [Streptomyces pathocidini]|uniref:hypothetical protein n=1 Tax=Streptomyces pathocidini TaxID=1650571 RepID=UPI0033E66D27